MTREAAIWIMVIASCVEARSLTGLENIYFCFWVSDCSISWESIQVDLEKVASHFLNFVFLVFFFWFVLAF